MKYVIIVNGKPESGKTTFENFCKDCIDINEYGWPHIVSSIDPIKEVYKQLGWNGNKGDKERKHLSDLKKIWIESCNGPTQYIVDYVMRLKDDGDSFIFTDVREESEIIKLKDVLDALSVLDIKCETVLIERQQIGGIEHGNKSDDNAGQNKSLYTTTIRNDGYDLDEFRVYAYMFIESLVGLYELN